MLKIKKLDKDNKKAKHLSVKVLIKSTKAHSGKPMDKFSLRNLNPNLSTIIKDHQAHHQMKMKTFYKVKLTSSMNIPYKRNKKKVSQEVSQKLRLVWRLFIADFKMAVSFHIVNKRLCSSIFNNLPFLIRARNNFAD